MATHDDDHCDELKDDISVLRWIIEKLKKELTDCREQLNDALRYGFEKNQDNMRLLKHIKGLEGKIREVIEDGKDW